MTVVLLTGDLMAISRVGGAAAASGIEFRAASTAPQAAALCREMHADVLIIDLATPSLDAAAVVADVRSGTVKPPVVVAFGPHVHEQRLNAAREAGCDRVVSRGQFFAQLDAMLQL